MIKFFFKVLILLLLQNLSVSSEVIKKFDIKGNKRISDQTILVLGELSKDKDFSSTELNDSLRKLYKTNFFSDIKISLNNGILKVRVVENPIIEDIEILGEKNKTLLETINEKISLKNRMSFTENQLKRDVDLIKNIFKTNGFYFATVDTSIVKNEDLNSIRLRFDI